MIKGKNTVAKRVASERIGILYRLAEKEVQLHPELSKEYVRTLRKISAHYKVRLPQEIKNGVCKKCNTFLLPGFNSKIRLASKKEYIVYMCMNCGEEKHIRY